MRAMRCGSIALALALVACAVGSVACGGKTAKTGPAPADATAADATADTSHGAIPPDATSDAFVCELPAGCCSCPPLDAGGVCTCGDASFPVCNGASTSVACSNPDAICMTCLQGAGITCDCTNGGTGSPDAAFQWACVGSEQACTGGVP